MFSSSRWYLHLFCFCVIVRCSKIERLVNELKLKISTAEGNVSSPSEYPAQYTPIEDEEFDFVVVGGGSAGSAVAGRLTEVGGWTVLLLEAGGDPPNDSEVPALAATLMMTDIDWQYVTEPEPNLFQSHVNGSCRWPRGKVLGGSSVINFMQYTRGNRRDFDEWEEAGNAGWGYADVLPYFKKSEDLRSPLVLRESDALKYHGTGGCLTVESFSNVGNPLMRAFRKGFAEIGFDFNPDYNGILQSGFANNQNFLRDHRRCSNAKAFLTPARCRPNLRVSKYSLATKILIDNATLTAYGVEFINPEGRTVQVQAKKEVILSAGAINSPQLLLLSGVGPRGHLMDMGIPMLKDLPVGENLQDHPDIKFLFAFDRSPLKCPGLNTPSEASIQSTFDFLMRGRSSLSLVGGSDFGAFINTTCHKGFPSLQLAYLYFAINDTSGIRSHFESATYDEEVVDQVVKLNQNHFVVLWNVFLLRPFSRGRILLKDSRPQTHPRIIPGYFSDPRDMPLYLEAFDLFESLSRTDGVRRSGGRLFEIRVAACEELGHGTKEYRECWIYHLATTSYHPSSTCGMGGVVDSSLRVMGVSRLRVVDASVMPRGTSGNLNAPVTMIAEKACDLIKSTWL